MNCTFILYAIKVLVATLKFIWSKSEHAIQNNEFLSGVLHQGTSNEFLCCVRASAKQKVVVCKHDFKEYTTHLQNIQGNPQNNWCLKNFFPFSGENVPNQVNFIAVSVFYVSDDAVLSKNTGWNYLYGYACAIAPAY